MAQKNLITDVAGILVGHADDARLASGVSAIIFVEPAVVAVDVRGGAPATRDTDLLEPHRTVERIDAVVLSGGSVFGLEAATGVQAFLRERGRGFEIGGIRVPLVCGASMFDLLNGGDKNWGRFAPYRELGYSAAARRGRHSRSAPPEAASAAPPLTCRAGWARPPRSRGTDTRSGRWSWSTPAAASMSGPGRISGRRRSKLMTNSAGSAFP